MDIKGSTPAKRSFLRAGSGHDVIEELAKMDW
jgi:hypothetical protein